MEKFFKQKNFRIFLMTAAIVSIIAGLIHLIPIQKHFEEWWGYGVFLQFYRHLK